MSALEEINAGLRLLMAVRGEHHDKSGVCAYCGQTYPCQVIQSLDGNSESLMADDSKGKKQNKRKDKR